MANYNYKRGKSRARASTTVRSMSSWPRWHDILHQSRPRQRFVKNFVDRIVAGRLDAEEACWADEEKPHKYYW